MIIKKEIENEEDIKNLIHQFYAKVRLDHLLAPVFEAVVKDNWEYHLQVMCDFWSSMLLYTRKYLNDPMGKHMPLPIEAIHFDKWLFLFEETVDELFIGYNANDAKETAHNMARVIKNIKGLPL